MMAINRLILLTAIALVVIIAPAMGGLFEKLFPGAIDNWRLAELSKKFPSPDDVKGKLNSIEEKKQVKIGGYSVEELLYFEQIGLPILDDCKYVSFSKSPEDIKDSDLTLVLNVFNFVNHRDEKLKESCADNIKKNFDSIRKASKNNENPRPAEEINRIRPTDDELVSRAGEEGLFAKKVGILLYAVQKKSEIEIGGLRLHNLLGEEKRDHPRGPYCWYVSFSKSPEKIKDSDLTLLLNVFNFVYDRKPEFKESCAKTIKELFYNSKLLEELDEKISTGGLKDKLELVGDKIHFIIGGLTAQEILDDASKDSPTIEDCQLGSFSKRLRLKGSRNLVANIRNFIHYDRLVSFCAENFKQVYEKGVTLMDKQLIKEFFNGNPRLQRQGRLVSYETIDTQCIPLESYLSTTKYLMRKCQSDLHKRNLELIKSELEELVCACDKKTSTC